MTKKINELTDEKNKFLNEIKKLKEKNKINEEKIEKNNIDKEEMKGLKK